MATAVWCGQEVWDIRRVTPSNASYMFSNQVNTTERPSQKLRKIGRAARRRSASAGVNGVKKATGPKPRSVTLLRTTRVNGTMKTLLAAPSNARPPKGQGGRRPPNSRKGGKRRQEEQRPGRCSATGRICRATGKTKAPAAPQAAANAPPAKPTAAQIVSGAARSKPQQKPPAANKQNSRSRGPRGGKNKNQPTGAAPVAAAAPGKGPDAAKGTTSKAPAAKAPAAANNKAAAKAKPEDNAKATMAKSRTLTLEMGCTRVLIVIQLWRLV